VTQLLWWRVKELLRWTHHQGNSRNARRGGSPFSGGGWGRSLIQENEKERPSTYNRSSGKGSVEERELDSCVAGGLCEKIRIRKF